MWSAMNIPSRPHWPWIFLSEQNVVFAGINNPLMITLAVEEDVNKKGAWDTLSQRNYREASREAPKKMQH